MREIESIIFQAIDDKVFPGIEILVAKGSKLLFHKAFGKKDMDDHSQNLPLNALFDFASITKPIATTSAILHLVDEGLIGLDDPFLKYIPEFEDPGAANVSLRQLMSHSSGLPYWLDLFHPEFSFEAGWNKLMRTPLQNSPGAITVYSCLGYILLGEIIRRISRQDLKTFCRQNLFEPLDIFDLTFRPLEDSPENLIIPTGYCDIRKKKLIGVVHDENADLFNGEGGNSGLFGTASSLYKFCLALIGEGELNGIRILSSQLVREMFQNQNPQDLVPRALGWDIKIGNADYWSCGKYMPEGSVGHLGFTGTSLWMDPKSGIIIILLSNRVLISREDNIPQIREFRPALHDAVFKTFFN